MSLSRNVFLDDYSRRKKRSMLLRGTLLAAAIAGACALAAWVVMTLVASGSQKNTKNGIVALWNDKDYDEVYASAKEALVAAPVDPFFLSYLGYSAFYKGLQEVDEEKRAGFLDESISAFRKALLAPDLPLAAENEYFLGKAYYRRGVGYEREAVEFLEKARARGFAADDLYEHLGLAYAAMNDNAKALECFLAVAQKKENDQLFLAVASAASRAGDVTLARDYLERSLALTKDIAVYEKAMLLKFKLYFEEGNDTAAEAVCGELLERYPESSDAHVSLGLIYRSRHDEIKARAEFRKALELDPMNVEARQELSKKF